MAWLTIAACGGAPRSSTGDRDSSAAPPAVADTRTPLEQRRDAACEQLGPRLTGCAVEDAKADFAAGKISRAQLDADTAPGVQRKNTEEFLKACRGVGYSSRQVRVLEVCPREEAQCGPLITCLGHLNDATAPSGENK